MSDLAHFLFEDPLTGDEQDASLPSPIRIGSLSQNELVLHSHTVDAYHAKIELNNGQWEIEAASPQADLKINDRAVSHAVLTDGDLITIGQYDIIFLSGFLVEDEEESEEFQPTVPINLTRELAQMSAEELLAFANQQATLPDEPEPETSDFPPPAFNEQLVALDGLEYDETTYLTLGGGLGSFVWIDHLLIFGADPSEVRAIGVEPKPYGKFWRFAGQSQIPIHERLRSDSGSTPDNIWGWPGYAVREAYDHFTKGKFGIVNRILWQIFAEPALAETFTPVAERVFKSIDREAKRIGWENIWEYGRIRSIRKTDDGRYIVGYSQSDASGRSHKLIVAQYVHLAVGYPGIRFLRDLQNYRASTQDFEHVVNAYEDHNHVYDHLAAHGGTVLLRGRGIVASRILQRIDEIRRTNPNITIIHLMRAPRPSGATYGQAQRMVEHHFEYQPFNWPKATVGGDLRQLLENASMEERAQLLTDWGGTTTAERSDWRDILRRGTAEGWYQIRFGHVATVEPTEDQRIATLVRSNQGLEEESRVVADYIIDATGLNANMKSNPLLNDMIEHYALPLNIKGGFAISADFNVVDMNNRRGQFYTAGVAALGGPYAPVDSFIGLQYAAQRSVYHLISQQAPNLKPLDPMRSFSQWLRWARGVQP